VVKSANCPTSHLLAHGTGRAREVAHKEHNMKKDNENQKRLKLDSETLRRLEGEDLNVVVGGIGQPQEAGVISLSVFQCGCSVGKC
jgi:hypothetical protein